MEKIVEKIASFIERGELIMSDEYHHVTDEGILMPDYISGPKTDQWFNEICIFNSRHLVGHPLYEQIDNVCKNHNKLFSSHKTMMGYLRALLADDELEISIRQVNETDSKLNESNTNININRTKVFISYSWEEDEHKNWVRSLADSLLNEGIDATIDQYDLSLGDRLPQFMEQSITKSDYVLIICTPEYKRKADERKGGVGYEGHIISGELFEKGDEKKFIPVIRKGTVKESIPTFLQSKLAVDFSDEKHYEDNFNDLITTLHGIKKKPIVRKTFESYKQATVINQERNYEPTRILGIITDEVTIPKMDGTRGSALYKIPFRLSKNPSSLWKDIFVKTWNYPPKFTTMHRPGIASVIGDQIILDGTSIEEVRDYHRETLTLCVNIANKEEKKIIEEEKDRLKKEQELKNAHFSNVEKIADDIKF